MRSGHGAQGAAEHFDCQGLALAGQARFGLHPMPDADCRKALAQPVNGVLVVKARAHPPPSHHRQEERMKVQSAWVGQSINQAAASHFNTLANELAIATVSGSSFLTSSPFSTAVLETASPTPGHPTIESNTTNAVLRLDLEAFDDLSIDNLMTARADGEAFALFRRELEKQFRDLRMEQDPVKLQGKTENAMHELMEVQLTL